MFLSGWREFPSAPCFAKKKSVTARISMLLKSRESLTCFRAGFLPGRANDLSALRYYVTSLYDLCATFPNGLIAPSFKAELQFFIVHLPLEDVITKLTRNDGNRGMEWHSTSEEQRGQAYRLR